MAQDMGRGIIAPENNENIQNGAHEMRTIAQTTAAALNGLDGQVSSKVGNLENLAGVNTNDIRVWRQATAEIQSKIDQIEQNLEPGEDGKDGDPGPPGPGGSIALEETDPGCFVDSEITWMQWPQSGGLPAVWNPNTESYENPIRVDTSVGTTISIGDHIIHHESGWRDVTDHMRDGWSGNVYVWRNENTVFYNFRNISRSEDASATVVGAITGYTPLSTEEVIRAGLVTSDSPAISYRANITQYGATLVIPPEVTVDGRVSFPTQRTIPASLPGTPA